MNSDLNIRVSRDLCIACGICVDRCIMDNLRLSVPPCAAACPLHMNCMGYVRMIAQGKEREAAEEMRKHTPFAGILGRVCSHPCEPECERAKMGDGAVHIRALKRYLADNYPEVACEIPRKRPVTNKRVAIVGSGPAGLQAAYELRVQGHGVTVFERESEAGGLLRWGIPTFRLPKDEVLRALDMLVRMGVAIRTGETIGQGISFEEIERKYDAVLLAVGAGGPARLGIPGEDIEGVHSGLELLKAVRGGTTPRIGESVMVIGGGNAALDAALTCRKLGDAQVKVVCLEKPGEMPAFQVEIDEAVEEGVIIENSWGPESFGRRSGESVIQVRLVECVSVFDEQRRFLPKMNPARSTTLMVDSIVVAIGQSESTQGMPETLVEGPRFVVDPLTGRSIRNPKVFACGDAATGARSVVEAMAQGREAAVSIDRSLRGEGLDWGRDFWQTAGALREYTADRSRSDGAPRGQLPRVEQSQRTLRREVEQRLAPEAAKREADRCISCGRATEWNKTCWYCLPCEIDCPTKALEVRIPYLVR